MFEGNGTAVHVKQWVLLESVRWLRELSDELVPVLVSAEHFLAKIAVKRTDMPFALAAFRKLLSGTLRSHGTPTDTANQVQVASGARAGRRGERCCRPADKAAKRRRCSPRKRERACGQEYIMRGLFDGDDDEEGGRGKRGRRGCGAPLEYVLGPRGRGARDHWRRS